jgi:small-conductance mechanosensitive channel
MVKVPFTMPRDTNLAGLIDAVKSHASSIPGLAPDRAEQLYKMGISKDDIQYELHFWVTDPRQSDDAKSRVIDIIGQFYPAKQKERAA